MEIEGAPGPTGPRQSPSSSRMLVAGHRSGTRPGSAIRSSTNCSRRKGRIIELSVSSARIQFDHAVPSAGPSAAERVHRNC
jgi:hypothetical protein